MHNKFSHPKNASGEKAEWVIQLQQEALMDNVPLMDDEGMEVLLQILRIKNPDSILEIGTGTGYSAIRMAHVLPDSSITTIEQDMTRYGQAIANCEAFNLHDRISVIHDDALNALNQFQSESVFEFIFIDAAKGQYQKYVEHADKLLSKNGVIVLDNVLFKGYVYGNTTPPKRFRHLVSRLYHFNEWLRTHPNFHTVILPVGDGIAISSKKG